MEIETLIKIEKIKYKTINILSKVTPYFLFIFVICFFGFLFFSHNNKDIYENYGYKVVNGKVTIVEKGK